MTARQGDLFGRPPRRKPRILMHAVDLGMPTKDGMVANMICVRCGLDDWYVIEPPDCWRRGIPCPVCNATGEE